MGKIKEWLRSLFHHEKDEHEEEPPKYFITKTGEKFRNYSEFTRKELESLGFGYTDEDKGDVYD